MLKNLTTLLFISGDPLPRQTIVTLLGIQDAELTTLLQELSQATEPLGLSMLISDEGISFTTQKEQAPLVEAFWKEELKAELTPSTLQVLTLVAYLENPTREEIAYIRGVQSSQSIRTLTARGLIIRKGEQCLLSHEALTYLGITSVTELPDYQMIHTSLREKLDARAL